jgi:hypothetical protein
LFDIVLQNDAQLNQIHLIDDSIIDIGEIEHKHSDTAASSCIPNANKVLFPECPYVSMHDASSQGVVISECIARVVNMCFVECIL